MSEKSILVFSDNDAVAQQLLGVANSKFGAEGWNITVVSTVSSAAAMGEFGASAALTYADGTKDPESMLDLLAEAVDQVKPAIVMIGATKLGLELAPRLSERVDAGYAVWAKDVSYDDADQSVTVSGELYTGTGLGVTKFKPGTVIVSVASGVFETVSFAGKSAASSPLQVPTRQPSVVIIEEKAKPAVESGLETARVVLDVGQGVKEHGDLDMIKDLSALFEGELGCSRPVASDRDWFPDWMGLSGAKIKADLCLTIGVSGAIQHIVGIRESRVIAAVNNDEGAPIFMAADYGVVADLYEFLPALQAKLASRGVSLAWK